MSDISRLQKLAGVKSTYVPVLQERELKDFSVNEETEEEKYERLETAWGNGGEAGLAKAMGMTEAQLNDIIDALASESHEWAGQVLTADDDRDVIVDRIMDLAADGQFDDHHFSKWDEDTNEGWGLDLVRGMGKGFKKGYKKLSRLGSKNTKDKYDGEGGFIGTDTTWNEDNTNEAVGEFAEPLYTLQDDLGLEDNILVDELARWMSGQDITDFVENFRRHHDMNHPGEDGDYDEDDKNFEGKVVEKAKPDYADIDGDGDEEETMKKAAKDKKLKEEPGEPFDHYDSLRDYEVDQGIAYNEDKEQKESEGFAFPEFGPLGWKHIDGYEYMIHNLDTGEDTHVEVGVTDDTQSNYSAEEVLKMHQDGDYTQEILQMDLEAHKRGYRPTATAESETIKEAPTMDTTQLITLMKNAGLSEEAITAKINEWANSPEDASETEATSHGDAYEFAQNVNTSLKKYLDAQDMKVGITEHTVEDLTKKYLKSKNV